MTTHPLPPLPPLPLPLPENLQAERWLVVGEDAFGLTALAAARGAEARHAAQIEDYAGEPVDVVVCQQLFQGIRHPLWLLEKLCAITRRQALLQAHPLSHSDRAILRWDDTTASWQTNRTALARMARSAGFACVESLAESPDSLWLKALRQWPEQPLADVAALTIRHVFNPVTNQQQFPRSGRRAFLAIVVAGLPPTARRWDIRVSIGEFGVQPIYVGQAELAECLQVNVPISPGLPLGLVEIRLWHRQDFAAGYAIELSEGTPW